MPHMASLWKLPVMLVCENNGYAEFTPMSAHTVVSHVSDMAGRTALPSQIVDGNDTLAVLDAGRGAVTPAREGGGPTIVECLTYRLRGHYVGDPETYRKSREGRGSRRDKVPFAARRLARAAGKNHTEGCRGDGSDCKGACRRGRSLHDGKPVAMSASVGRFCLRINEKKT